MAPRTGPRHVIRTSLWLRKHKHWALIAITRPAAFSITVLGNVPLNNQLASDQGSGSAADSWKSFQIPWHRFNFARTILSTAVPVVLGYSLVI